MRDAGGRLLRLVQRQRPAAVRRGDRGAVAGGSPDRDGAGRRVRRSGVSPDELRGVAENH